MKIIPEPEIEYEQNEWEQVILRNMVQERNGAMGGEGMQMIFDITYAPSSPETVYFISDTSRVWKSSDGGYSWRLKSRGFLTNGGISVSVDPVNENIVFVAGSFHRLSYSSPADGIYRSVDGGENWDLVKHTPFYRGREGEHFAFGPADSNDLRTSVVYAGTHTEGLLLSRDGGNNWKNLGFKGERILDMKFKPDDPSVLYLLTRKGFYSVNLRNHKIVRTRRLGDGLTGDFRTFAVNSQNPLIIYVAMGKGGVYKSIDGAKTFSKLKIELEKSITKKRDFTHIAISPVNPEFLYVSVDRSGWLNPFWSHDGGRSWHRPKTIDRNKDSLTHGRYFSAPISPHPFDADTALTNTNGAARILKTDDAGISWFYSGNGYTGGMKTDMVFPPDTEKMLLFLLDHGTALTVDGGRSYKLFPTGSTMAGAVSPLKETNMIVAGIHGGRKLAVSRDHGKNWEIVPGIEDDFKFIAFHPQKPNIIYAQKFISKDAGKSWERFSQNIRAMFRGNGDTVYSIDDFGNRRSVIRRSDDQGMTWTKSYPFLPGGARSINEIDVDPLNPDRIYVAAHFGFFIFDDKKEEWLKKDKRNGLIKDSFGWSVFKCVAVDPRHPEIVYTGRYAPTKGQSNGIFRSVDYGETWTNISGNLGPDISVWSIDVSPFDGSVYIGSFNGTWKLPPPYWKPY